MQSLFSFVDLSLANNVRFPDMTRTVGIIALARFGLRQLHVTNTFILYQSCQYVRTCI